ncbi:cation:proton antiporter, partial [uncultured Bifidobacterium sp.]|uniref:cation:proton antiporter domain-containing protein n=1 Tax=uncultured Bifidobacterium sp. TaxID=165187 RepID=UPI00258726A5
LLYLGAEAIHVSGILSVVAAGLIIRFDRSGVGPNVARTNIVASSVWSVLSFALNGAVFILLGMLLPDAMEASWNDQQISNLTLLATILIVAAVVVGMRFAWVAAMLRITRHEVTRKRRRMTKERWRSAAVMTFGGPKGTITLSLMLKSTDDSRAITEASIEVLRRTVEELAERVTPDNRRAVMAVIDSYTKRITRLKHRLGAIDPIGFSELQIAALEWEKDYVKGRLAATKAQTGEQSVDRDLEIEACERLLDQIMTSLRHAVTDHDSAHAIWQIKGRMRSLQRRIKILSSRVNNLIRKNTPMLSEHQIYAHMRTVQTAAIDNVIDHLYDEMGKSTYNTEYCSALLLDYRRAEATLKARPNMGATTEMITQIEEIKRESYGIELGVIQDMLEADDITRSQARQLRKNVYVMSVAADSSI